MGAVQATEQVRRLAVMRLLTARDGCGVALLAEPGRDVRCAPPMPRPSHLLCGLRRRGSWCIAEPRWDLVTVLPAAVYGPPISARVDGESAKRIKVPHLSTALDTLCRQISIALMTVLSLPAGGQSLVPALTDACPAGLLGRRLLARRPAVLLAGRRRRRCGGAPSPGCRRPCRQRPVSTSFPGSLPPLLRWRTCCGRASPASS